MKTVNWAAKAAGTPNSQLSQTSGQEMAEEAILGYLENNELISDSGKFAAERGLDHNDVVNVIKSLHGFRYVDAQVFHLSFQTLETFALSL